MPALVQRQGVLLIAGIVAAAANLAFAVAYLHQIDAAVGLGAPVAEIGEVAEGAARVVELGDGVNALGLGQQVIVGPHAGVSGLVVQRGVVAGDDTLGHKGVHVAGTARPGHLKAGDGDDVRVAGVEFGNGVLVGGPALLAVLGGLAQVIEGLLRVGFAGLVKVVGVVGKGHEVHIGLLGQLRNVLQSAAQGAGAVGILAVVGVELAEVELIVRLSYGKAPGLAGVLAVGAGDGDGDGDAAIRHVGVRLIGQLAVS